jgi:hypothetical protein
VSQCDWPKRAGYVGFPLFQSRPYQGFIGTIVARFFLPPNCHLQEEEGGNFMKQSEIFRENAENCTHLAEAASSEPAFLRYKRMEAAWRCLAHEQDWLDGEIPPVGQGSGRMDESHENP